MSLSKHLPLDTKANVLVSLSSDLLSQQLTLNMNGALRQGESHNTDIQGHLTWYQPLDWLKSLNPEEIQFKLRLVDQSDHPAELRRFPLAWLDELKVLEKAPPSELGPVARLQLKDLRHVEFMGLQAKAESEHTVIQADLGLTEDLSLILLDEGSISLEVTPDMSLLALKPIQPFLKNLQSKLTVPEDRVSPESRLAPHSKAREQDLELMRSTRVELRVPSFVIPLNPTADRPWYQQWEIPQATLAMNRISAQPGYISQTLLNTLFASPSLSAYRSFWLTPAVLKMDNGVISLTHRLDAMMDDEFHVCLWGDIDLHARELDLVIGIPAETLIKKYKLERIPRDSMQRIPLKIPYADTEEAEAQANAALRNALLAAGASAAQIAAQEEAVKRAESALESLISDDSSLSKKLLIRGAKAALRKSSEELGTMIQNSFAPGTAPTPSVTPWPWLKVDDSSSN